MTNRQNTTNPRVAAATTALCEAIGERFTTGCPIAIFHEDMAKALDAAGMGELPKSDSDTTEAEVDLLAQVIRKAHVMTQIDRHSGFTMRPWADLIGRERAPYIASAVAAYRHINGHETDV